MMKLNPAHLTDGYKTGHIRQFPEGTTEVYSNFTCRSAKHFDFWDGYDYKVVWFGLQAVCKWYLQDVWREQFFHEPKSLVVGRYKRVMDAYLGKDAVSINHIAALHDLQMLPIEIKALPEGSRVDIRIPLFTIKNTLPDFYWLTNYLETSLSALLWKSVTSATTAYEYRRMFEFYANVTGGDPAFVDWQGHDFSFRGMSGVEDAILSGAAHLTSFTGTDTIPAIDYVDVNYGAMNTLIGGSVPATEHAVMCMGGEHDEISTFRRIITDLYPTGVVSIVSDTWDFWKVMTEFTAALKPEIMARNGKVVFRPDSGDPVKIICGDPMAKPGSPEFKGAVKCLWDVFGGTTTDKGCRVLDSHVGLIYGDSITLERADEILSNLRDKGFASNNIVFGIGSFTYQHVTRDTFGTAIKATSGVVNGVRRDISKAPKTDDGTKHSACGLLRVEYENGKFVLYDRQTEEQEQLGLLKPVFRNSQMMRHEMFPDIRARIKSQRNESIL